MVPAWIFLAASLLLMKYLWSRRWVYYYTWKIAGPVSFPIIGSTHLLLREGYDGLICKYFLSIVILQLFSRFSQNIYQRLQNAAGGV